ncbi:MAG: adenylate/guanylate cyclase domain-containing protein [Rhodospirillales bacterium]|nr:adenylate/guanylate cyclase domain-containing protein [Rhodospirillales bacterium]
MFRTVSPKEIFPVLAIIMLAAAAGVVLPRGLASLQASENWLSDYRFATLTPPEPQNADVVVVAITEDTLATLPYRSPVDRGFLADLFGALEKAKPRAIGIDILFDQPSEPAKDAALRQKLLNSSVPVVVVSATQKDKLTKPQVAYLKSFTDGLNTGLGNLVKDRVDGTVRWIFSGTSVDGKWRPSFPASLAKTLGLAPLTLDQPLVYRGGPNASTPAFKIFPAQAVPHLPKSWFSGKVVLIGADLPLIDRHRTPFAASPGTQSGDLPGVVVVAHGVAQLIDGQASPSLTLPIKIVLIVLVAVVGVLFAAFDLPLLAKGALYLIALGLFWMGGFAVYRYGGHMIPLIAPTLSFATASSLGIAYLGKRDRDQKKFIRDAFQHYVSPSIVNQLVAHPENLNVGGERRELTYLFTDLANFTSLTESTEPSVLVPLLNDYLSQMCGIMFEHGATIDKIVGDAVIGFFNAPLEQPDHPARAVAAALALDAFGQTFVEQQAKNGLTVGITRIGVHSGVAVIGNFGGKHFFDYTGHGDMVNTAARLESVNKHLGTRVCISRVTASACPDKAFRPVGALVLKGKSQGIDVFEPLSDEAAGSPSVVAYLKAYDLMQRDDPAAAEGFREVLKLRPDDGLAQFHLRRLENGEAGATIVMGEK